MYMANKGLIINSDLDTGQKVVALIACIAQEMVTEMERSIKHLNLSLTQVQILHVLSHSPEGRLTVNQIKGAMVVDSPNVSRSLNKLMENELIVKERSTEDQRVVHITVTDKGREYHDEADKFIVDLPLNLNDEEKEKLYQLLVKL
ncbi:MarR family transcriptional regulator [Planctomycetota bacterium]|nr:MarR family transcriptional regulator [Planctomycetota bacterium]